LDSNVFYFVLSAVPFSDVECDASHGVEHSCVKNRQRICGYTNDALVFVRSGHCEKPVEVAVSSFVSIQAYQMRFESGVYVPESAIALVAKIISGSSDREMKSGGVLTAKQGSSITDCLIQRVSDVADYVIRCGSYQLGKWLLERYIENFFA